MPKNVESREAEHGQKMIEVKLRFWTNDIAQETGQIVFSSAFVGACELPNWIQAPRQVNACRSRSPAPALFFPSGEALPRCWVDAGYKESTG